MKKLHKQVLKMVYSKKVSWIISGITFSILLLVLLHVRELLFFEPLFVLYVPIDLMSNFILIIITSGLISIVSSLLIYQFRIMRKNPKKTGTGIIGSLIGISAGICSGCSTLGFTIMSVFGFAGAASLSFLYTYEIPIRLLAISLLSVSYYVMVKGISGKCNLVFEKNNNKHR